MNVDDSIKLSEHLKVLENIDENFYVFFYDHTRSTNDLYNEMYDAINIGLNTLSFLFVLESVEPKNQAVIQLLKRVGENIERSGIAHTIHGFFLVKKNYDEMKYALK